MDETYTYGIGEDGFLKELIPEGGCLNSELVQDRRITDSAKVDCAEPHSLQIFAARNYYEKPDEYDEWTDIEYPGVDNLSRFAEGHCSGVFGSDVVPDTSSLRYRALVPTKKAWEERRQIYCVLYDRDGKQMTKSFVE
jgi:hypothetical protein